MAYPNSSPENNYEQPPSDPKNTLQEAKCENIHLGDFCITIFYR